MSKLTPQEAAEKWGRRLKGATQDITLGVQRVKEAPGAKAAAKSDKMLQNVQEAVQSGKWADRVGAVTLEEWRAKMLNKGVGRISAGVDAAASKQGEFFGQLFDHQERLTSEINRMPDLTLEDSINRMTTFTRGMAKFRRK